MSDCALAGANVFDDVFADLVLARADDATVAPTVAFLVERLGLRAGGSVFDQGCGVGRLSLPLAARGLRVVGVDVTGGYVARARASAALLGLRCDLHTGDASTFVPARACDAAFNWMTSFGFADDDARNQAMLRCSHDALLPGGRFALDYPNVPRVLRELKEHMVTRYPTPRGEVVLERTTRPQFAAGRFEQEWTWHLPDGTRRVRRGGTQMYLPHQLRHMLGAAGFTAIELHGGIAGEPYDRTSPRCILLARRPEA